MSQKNIILGVCGSIAIYKSVDIIRLLQKEGANIKVIMTRNACRLITPLTFSAISRNKVYYTQWDEKNVSEIEHITLAKDASIFLIAPATANIIGKLAHGIADDFLTTFYLAYNGRVIVAPAMNSRMYVSEVVQRNISELERKGVVFVNPEEGYLACGEEGKGRLANPEKICSVVMQMINDSASLEGKRVLITAGPTHERIDLVRYISNYSSGKMGYALAREARLRGAEVVLISGPTNILPPEEITFVKVTSAEEMKNAVLNFYDNADIVIMAAAVADYQPEAYSELKIKRGSNSLNLKLIPTEDILKLLGGKKKRQILIGFAAENGFNKEEAIRKLKLKNADAILLNDISRSDVGFGVDENQVIWIDKYGVEEKSDKLYKSVLSKWIWDIICKRMLK